jgi:hypothetical protein
MTAIAAWVADGRVWIGGDSAAVSNWVLDLAATPKVFALGPMVIGYTSSFRMGQAIQHRLSLPPGLDAALEDVTLLDRWMAVDFSDAVRSVMRDIGYLKVENARESSGVFIVGIRGHLYEADDDLHVRRTPRRYASCGCGREATNGALHAWSLIDSDEDPEFIITTALAAAEAGCIGVRGPFHIIQESSQ